MSVFKLHGGLFQVFSHACAFNLQSLLLVYSYITLPSELPQEGLLDLLFFQFTPLILIKAQMYWFPFYHQSLIQVPPSSTSPHIHWAAGLHDHIGLWDNGSIQQAVYVPHFDEG